MEMLIEWRDKEVEAVYYEKGLVDIILTMTHELEDHMTSTSRTHEAALKWKLHGFIVPVFVFITVDVDEMVARQQVDIEAGCLKDFMEVHQVDVSPTDQAGVVTYFHLDQAIRDMAKILYTFQKSHLFKMCWVKQAKNVAAEDLEDDDLEHREVVDIKATPEMICDEIFQPAYSDYQEIHTLLKSGQVTLKDVNQLFGDFKGNYAGLVQELKIMSEIEKGTDKQWIHNRVQQIEQYHELHLAVASAEMIAMVKETLCLQGDFKVLETLREAVRISYF